MKPSIYPVGLGVLTLLVLSTAWVAIVTHQNTSGNAFIRFAVNYHVIIMLLLMLVSVVYGVLWSVVSYSWMRRKSLQTKSILDIVVLFLQPEEREILDYLVRSDGVSTQADVARLPGMNRVKAHRALQRMQQKSIINIIPHGKVRKIQLRGDVFSVLKD
jgi:uncharacterized membrane protein